MSTMSESINLLEGIISDLKGLRDSRDAIEEDARKIDEELRVKVEKTKIELETFKWLDGIIENLGQAKEGLDESIRQLSEYIEEQ